MFDRESSRSERLRALRDLNTDDLLRAAGLVSLAESIPSLRRLFDAPSLSFAKVLDGFDQIWGLSGSAAAGRWLLGRLGTRVCFQGAEPLTSGPRLFIANHPGLGDVLALVNRLALPDLKILAREREVLSCLPHLSQSLILVPEKGAWSALRHIEEHLKNGGALLTFPAGRIEPDPAWNDPSKTWNLWSDSTRWLAQRVPGLSIQPCLVAGVRAPAFVDPWAARLRRLPLERDWAGAVLQLFSQVLLGKPRYHRIDVAIGTPLESFHQLKASLEALAAPLRRR